MIFRWLRRLLRSLFGHADGSDGDDQPDVDPDPTPKPDPEPTPDPDPKPDPEPEPEPEPDPEPECAEADWNEDAADLIQVAIYHRDGDRAAADVARSYAEYAIADAFGADYRVDVYVVDQPVPESATNAQAWGDYVNGLSKDVRGSDANHLIGGPDGGGGRTSTGGNPGPISELDPDCVERKGHGDPHFEVNMVLHELGHAFGMSHKEQGRHGGYGTAPVVPMATSYINSTPYAHEYHADSIAESDY